MVKFTVLSVNAIRITVLATVEPVGDYHTHIAGPYISVSYFGELLTYLMEFMKIPPFQQNIFSTPAVQLPFATSHG